MPDDHSTGADNSSDGRITLPWQSIANLLFAALIVLGGYVWTQTTTNVVAQQTINSTQAIQLASLEVRTASQEETVRLLRDELRRMNDKMDRLLAASR